MILGIDPLLSGGIGLAEILIVLVKGAITLGICLIATMLMIWFERKVVSDLQNRIGPNRAGPWGILQTLADGLKVILKEDLIPEKSDRLVFRLAPILTMVPAFITFGLIPLGGDFRDGKGGLVRIFGHDTLLQLANPNAGVLVILAMSSIAVYGVMLAGWSSGSKYPLLGSVRASAQMVSYEAALGLSVLAVVLVSSRNGGDGTLTTNGIVAAQAPWGWNLWITGLVPFVIFVIAATAELNRPPFDLVEAESELVAGFMVEYSSTPYLLFMLGEYVAIVTMCALTTVLFLGGWLPPFDIPPLNWVPGIVWFVLNFQSKPLWQGLGLLFGLSIVVLVTVTLLTPPESKETLKRFYARCRPPGFWKPISDEVPLPDTGEPTTLEMFVDSILGIVSSLGLVLATNAVFVGDWPRFFVSIAVCVITAVWLLRRILLKSRMAKPVEKIEAEVVR